MAKSQLRGKIVLKESGVGIPDLQVVILDQPAGVSADDTRTVPRRLCSVLTDRDGAWSYTYEDPVGEKRPNLVLQVLAPEDPGGAPVVLYQSKLVRQNAAPLESYLIRLTEDALKRADIPSPTRQEDAGSVDEQLARYRIQQDRKLRLTRGVAEYHKPQVDAELRERKAFKDSFIKTIATDFDKVPITGVVVKGDVDIKTGTETVVNTGIEKANRVIGAKGGVPINLYLTPTDRERLSSYFDDAVDDYATIPESEIGPILFRRNSSDNPGTLLVNKNPIAASCMAETIEQKCAREHTGVNAPEHAGEHGSEGGGEGGDDDSDGTPTNGHAETITAEDLPKYIARLTDSMRSPDSVMNPSALGEPRADKKAVEDSVASFSLQRGPAEVPAFYDFQSLQIAFDHVWQQLVDTDLVNTAEKLDRVYKQKFGADLFAAGNVLPVMSDFAWMVEVPAAVAANFDITRDEYNDLSPTLRARLDEIAENIDAKLIFARTKHVNDIVVTVGPDLKTSEIFIQQQREQGERIIDSVRHDDYYSMHKTLRDLHEKLNGAYEFTVFAADKDYHSVNFGILKTYRQQWTPLNYQAGKLVKTIPLSPKEERKYNVKIARSVKHATKEARKNSSSVSGEQSTTARAESDIIARAQNKTNFNLSTEGTYNIGISKGKTTSSFGVDAQTESSQDRKDFRESVIKAAQEYKEDHSIEIDTEETTTAEYSESGTIVNPNDELSVTYLFYELQRRYRVSEQLYRVMPVVLVAQEVPSPAQITEAWVIANDWIINRFLLDDSFRSALDYLSSKGVGADFALRELRRNLRQQRGVVEALKIELTKASDEVENRYRALENAINYRIQQQSEEETDSWFADIGEFFGGGGQNPEAAKARELAANDAHQRAVEKAQKVAVALQQETNNLRSLTNEYNKAMQTHLDNETRVKRLLVHIRNNIYYYMQAIWSMEPADQRFLRLHKVQVPKLELETNLVDGIDVPNRSYRVKVVPDEDIFQSFREPGTTRHKAFMTGKLKTPFETVPLVEVADLDALLGFKGNYMIFRLKEHNALTEFMAAPYVDSAFGAMDPDELSNINLDDYSKFICCLHERLEPAKFEALKPQLKKWLELLLANPLRNGDELVVPTGSLFIEALPDVHPLLENFKLRHRELDVFKVQAEVRRAELENLRYAARLLWNEREDPEIEKTIMVQGANDHTVVNPDG